MASLSLNKDIFRKFFHEGGSSNDPSGGGYSQVNDFFMREIGRESGPYTTPSVSSAYKASVNNLISKETSEKLVIDASQQVGLVTIKDTENLEATASAIAIESFANAETFSSTLPPTASDLAVTSLYHGAEILNDRRVHEAWDVGQQIKSAWAEGVKSFGTKKDISTYSQGDDVSRVQMQNMTYKEFGASGRGTDLNALPGQETSFLDYLGDMGTSKGNVVLSTEKANVGINYEEINTGNADYDAQIPFLYPLHRVDGENIRYMDIGHSEAHIEKEKEMTRDEIRKYNIQNHIADEKLINQAEAQRIEQQDKRLALLAEEKRIEKEIEKFESDLKIEQYDALQKEQAADRLAAALEASKQEGIKQSAFQRKKDVEKRIKDLEWDEYKKRSQERTRENFEKTLQGQGESYLNNDITDESGEQVEIEVEGIGISGAEQTQNAEKAAAALALKEEEARIAASGIQGSPGGDDHFKGAEEEIKANELRELEAKTRAGLEKVDQRKLHEAAGKQWRDEEGDVVEEKNDNTSLQEVLNNGKANFKEKAEAAVDKANAIAKEAVKEAAKTPAGLISNDPYAFSTHAYPSDVVEDFTNGHYMLFYVNVQDKTKYIFNGYDDKGNEVTIGDMVETHRENVWTGSGDGPRGEGGDAKFWKDKWESNKGAKDNTDIRLSDIEYAKRAVARGGKGNILKHNQTVLRKGRKAQTGLASYYPTTTRITDSVAIYLPPNVQDNISASYNDFQTGMAGFLAMGGVNILQQLRDHDFQGAAHILMGQGAAIAEEALKKFALGTFGALTGSEGVRETFDKAFGQSLNPYLEVAFDNMGLRSFSYTFHFAPKSAKESLEVKDIIQLFRFHMAPELKGTNHRYLTLPSTFDIHYMFQSGMGDKAMAKENSFYSKIATCVLKGCDVNYTPTGVRSFDDGAPTQIDMTLSFTETEMLTKQKINEGY